MTHRSVSTVWVPAKPVKYPKNLTWSLKLSTIPPPLRCKSDFYCPTMDALIDNDTWGTHFQLSEKASRSLLNYIYSDALLFPAANLSARDSVKLKHASVITMDDILQFCRTIGLYSKSTKKCKHNMWLANCPALGPQASTEREAPLTAFFNTVLSSIQSKWDTVKPM